MFFVTDSERYLYEGLSRDICFPNQKDEVYV